jgi:hypothetical protein
VENKDPNNVLSYGPDDSNQLTVDGGVIHAPPPDPDALSQEPGSLEQPFISQEQLQTKKGLTSSFIRFARRADVLLFALLIIGAIGVFVTLTQNKQRNNATGSNADKFGTVKLPLDELISGKELTLAGAANVTINGPMQLNAGLSLTPSLQPTGAKAGQIYYDQTNNQLAYYNGSGFVFLTAPDAQTGIQSLGGSTGAIALGSGLTISNNQLASSGVLTVQGQNGNINLTAGPGMLINGTNFTNTGVLSVAAGTPNVTVGNDGNGNVTISVDTPIAGTGTVTSSGGTAGHIPLFTGSQNIEDSIVTQSGLTVTINGDLSVVTGGLSLSNALTVPNGGTGANSLATNGVLVGQGTAAVTSVTAGGPGLCLLSTAGAPTWGACPSGTGVNSLNGLNGALNLANASGAGSTITIDDASTTNKGIASFNNINFTASSGAINTVQNINTTATPTFAGVNTNNITPSAALTVGISAQTALLQGSTTTITSNGVGNNIVLNSAGTIELQDDTNVTGSIATSGDLAVNGGDITSTGALNITPAGALTIGAASQTLTLQGGAATSFRATSGGNTTVVAFTNPVANTTLNFPALTAGTYTICTTSGNCSGAATTLQGAYDNSSNPEIVLDATRGAFTLRDNATPLGANLLEVQNNAGSATYLAVTANGVAVTGTASVTGNINSSTGALQTGGTTRIDNSGNAVNVGNLTLSGAISGGTTVTASGNINSSGGALQTNSVTRIDNSGNLTNIGTITASGNATFQGGNTTIGTTSQAGTLTLSDGSSNTGILQVAALGQNTTYILPDPGGATATICLTTGNCAGTGGGVTTGGGTTNKLAKFTGTQAIGDSSISDDGTNVTVSVDVIVQGGDLTLGTTSQPASMILHDGNGQTTTLQAGNSAGNLTFILPTNTGTANQCLKQSGAGNQLVWQDCDGGAGGTSATLQTAYNNSTNPEITLNSSVGGLTIRDNSTPLGANLFEIQNNAGSTTYLAVTVSGLSVTGTSTATGNINSSGGALQTNGTSRIDNSGNAVNIGNITGSGAITIASIGAGNDITVDGADQFIVQDSAVFNALSTFNANVDVGGNNIIGTTGNIDLTNFDVVGTTGNVTAGTYNGQTISSSANFTGTVAAAGNITTSGDIAVNGGDITSSGALNITPSGILTVGVTGQQLILQGSATTKLTATGSGFTTTLGFTGTPTAAVNYNLDRAAAAGTYTICTTIGNCAGTGGGVTTPGGTTGTLAVFTGSQTLGDSLLSQSGGTVTVNGNVNITSGNQFRVNGTQISSANLSNDANLAKLSASQTFTGNTVAFQNTADSTNAFNVQNTLGNRVMTVDTTSGQVVLGVASTLNGKLVFNNVSNANTVTIVPGTPTANRTLTLPDVSGVICTDAGNCAGAGATLQTAYNFSVGGTTPKIKVNSTLMGVDIQDADTTIGGNLFNVRASNGAGLGSVMFGVGNTGAVTLQNSSNSTSAFRLLTAGGTTVLTGDTTNGQITLGQSSTLSGVIVFNNATNANTVTLSSAAVTGNRTILLPDSSGTICLSSGNCSGSGSSNTLQAAYDAGNAITTTTARDINFALSDTATDSNFLVDLQCDTSCGANGRFAIQDDGTDVFSVAPAGGAALFKNSVNSTNAFRVQNAAGTVNLFTLDTTNILARFSNAGSDADTTSGTGAIQIGSDSGANLAFDDNEIIARNNGSTSTLFLQNGGGGLSIGADAVSVQGATSNSNALVVRNAAGRAVANVDTVDGELELGDSTNLTGALLFRNATNSFASILRAPTLTANRTITLPDETGTVCIQGSTACSFAPTTGSANYIQNQNASQQAASNFWISGNGRADTALQSPLFDTPTAVALNIGTTNATGINLNKSTTVTGGLTQSGGVIDLAGNAASTIRTTSGNLDIRAFNTNTLTLNTSGAGTVNLGVDNTTTINVGGGTDVARTINVGNPAAGTANQTVTLGTQHGTSVTTIQGGNSGTAIAITPANGGSVGITTTGAGAINLTSGGAISAAATGNGSFTAGGSLTLTAGGGSTWSTTSGNLTIQAATTNNLTLQTGGAGTVALGDQNTTTINIGRGSNIARTINIGTAGTSTAQTVAIGSAGSTSTTTIQGGTGAGAVAISAGTNGSINATTTGTGKIGLKTESQVFVQSTVNSTAAFQVQNDVGGFLLNVDTSNSDVDIVFLNVSYSSFGDVILDTNQASGNFKIGTTNATAIAIGRSGVTTTITGGLTQLTGAVSLTGNAASSFTTSAGNLTLQAATTNSLILNTGGAGTVAVGDTNSTTLNIGRGSDIARAINIGTGGSTTAQAVAIGSTGSTSTTTINGGSGASAISLVTSSGGVAITPGANGSINATSTGTGTTNLKSATQILAQVTGSQTSGFVIQNSGNTSLFTVDTTNSRVYIGNPTSDSTAAVLVLDTSTGGDPGSAVNGSMYYSTVYNAMRCYQDGVWSNCSDPTRLSHGFNIQEDFAGSDDSDHGMYCDGTTTISIMYSWSCWNGGANTTGHADVLDAVTASRPGIARLSTGASPTALGNESFYLFGGSTEGLFVGGGEVFETAVNIPTLSNGTQTYLIRAGLCDKNDHATDCTDGVYFEYNSASSANWRYATAFNNTRTKNSSTKAVAPGWTNLRFVANSSTSVTFYVKGPGETTWTNLGTISGVGTVPNSTSNTTSIMLLIDKSNGNADSFFDVDYVDYWNDLTANR